MDTKIKSTIKGKVKSKLEQALNIVCPEALKHVIEYCKQAYRRSFYHKVCGSNEGCDFPDSITEKLLRESREGFVNSTTGSRTGRMGVKEKCFNCHHILHGDHSLHAVEGPQLTMKKCHQYYGGI